MVSFWLKVPSVTKLVISEYRIQRLGGTPPSGQFGWGNHITAHRIIVSIDAKTAREQSRGSLITHPRCPPSHRRSASFISVGDERNVSRDGHGHRAVQAGRSKGNRAVIGVGGAQSPCPHRNARADGVIGVRHRKSPPLELKSIRFTGPPHAGMHRTTGR